MREGSLIASLIEKAADRWADSPVPPDYPYLGGAYKQDAEHLREVAALARTDRAAAIQAAEGLETVVRNQIPLKAYRWLFES